MSSSGSVKLRYEKCLQVWGNAIADSESDGIDENFTFFQCAHGSGSASGGTFMIYFGFPQNFQAVFSNISFYRHIACVLY
jgi:hypothetical protein